MGNLTCSGLVVGGPEAGKFLSHSGPIFRVPERLRFVDVVFNADRLPPVDNVVSVCTYQFTRTLFGIGLWAPIEWSAGDIAKELMRGYRPKVEED